MKYRLSKILKGYQPIHVADDRLVLVRRNRLYLANFRLDRIEYLCSLPQLKGIASSVGPRALQRVFRLGVESAAMSGHDTLFVARRSDIFRVSLSTGEWSHDFTIPDGRRLLNLSVVSADEDGRALVFGEYFSNPEKLPVRVWRKSLSGLGDWAIAGTFAQGEINHVHAVSQALDGSVRVLTGDFGDGAAIWLSDPTLRHFVPLQRGSQMIRACWLRQTAPGALFFATDTQFDRNLVRRLEPLDGVEPETLAAIEGSSIYSAQGLDRIFFSSTVEPGEGTGSFWRDLVDRVPGPGIVSDQAVIYGLEDGRVTEIARARKDAWPMRLAQFGTFQFPGGTMPRDQLFAYGMAVRRFDGATMCFDRVA